MPAAFWKIGSSWKEVNNCFHKVGSDWKQVNKIWHKTATGWKLAWQWVSVGHPNVSLTASGAGNQFANYTLNSNGNWYEYEGPLGYTQGSLGGAWLDAGEASDVWVSRVVNSGTLGRDEIGAGRTNLGSGTYDIGIGDTSPGGAAETAQVTLTFHDAASGGNVLDTAVINLSAQGI
jgi:hypothetical protein